MSQYKMEHCFLGVRLSNLLLFWYMYRAGLCNGMHQITDGVYEAYSARCQ
jgi:hypothetical protein